MDEMNGVKLTGNRNSQMVVDKSPNITSQYYHLRITFRCSTSHHVLTPRSWKHFRLNGEYLDSSQSHFPDKERVCV
jgi:hypothetical protein